MIRIAIRPDGTWWNVDEEGAEGDCDDVLRVGVPEDLFEDESLLERWISDQVRWTGKPIPEKQSIHGTVYVILHRHYPSDLHSVVVDREKAVKRLKELGPDWLMRTATLQ